MPEAMVIGLFDTLGDADDVRNRLKREGVPEGDIHLRLLREIEPLPPSMAAESEENFIDWFFGTTVAPRYATMVHNGETAVCVEVHSDEEAEIAVNTMRQFAPIDVGVVSSAEEKNVLRAAQEAGPPGEAG